MDADEIWPIWQSFGDLPHILGWVPYDWPPLHYLMVWLWRAFTGPDPLTMRLLSLLVFLLGTAVMVRAASRILQDRWAGLAAAAAYSAFGFSIYVSMLVRGYGLLYGLTPALLWTTVRLFEAPTPVQARRRSAVTGIVIGAMFYTHLTAIVIFAAVGLYSLIVYGRPLPRLMRWRGAVLVAAILSAPLIVSRLGIAVGRAAAMGQVNTPAFSDALGGWYRDFFGSAPLLWAALVVGCGALAWRAVTDRTIRRAAALTLWALLPGVLWAVNGAIGFFSLRHLAWVGVGLALLIGLGMARRPRGMSALVIIGVVALMWLPFPSDRYVLYGTLPTIENFTWLRREWQAGDVIYLDPTTHPGTPEMWDYFARAYFPAGLPFIANPDGYRRVWYVTVDGQDTAQTRALVARGRIARQFVGPWNFLFRLYEAPPDAVGVPYPNGLRFHGLTRTGAPTPGYLVAHENEALTFEAWWSVDQAPAADYSLAIQILDKTGALVAQSPDRAGSAETPRETSRWVPGRLYMETMTVTLPYNTYQPGGFANRDFDVFLVVYQWWDQVQVAPPGANDAGLLPLTTLHITAW